MFVVNIENKGFAETWGPSSAAPYLAQTLRSKGVLLHFYYGTAHHSEPNYVAQISGQGPNAQMQSDCRVYSAFKQHGTRWPGQAVGTGCVFPKDVDSLPLQMSHNGLSWKGYMEGMARPCEHPRLNSQDTTQQATSTHEYAARHDPFVYFRSITSRARYCTSHVVPLAQLRSDLQRVSTTPNLVYITPDLCDDGHDSPCANGEAGGLAAVNLWSRKWVPKILASPAFRRDGLLIITADESAGPQSDASACCGEDTGVNAPSPGISGPGGGRIGALVISRWTRPGSSSRVEYNHYSLLATIEHIFGLPRLGYARSPHVAPFGRDVFNRASS